MWVPGTGNLAGAAEELDFKFYLLLINLNSTCDHWLPQWTAQVQRTVSLSPVYLVTRLPSQVAGGLSERHRERRCQEGDALLPGPGRSQVLLKLS